MDRAARWPAATGTYNAYLDPALIARSWNLEQLDFSLYRIPQSDLIAIEHGLMIPYSPPRLTPWITRARPSSTGAAKPMLA